MTSSRKLGAALVRHARIVQHAVEGLSAPSIAARMGLCGATMRFWLKRLEEDMRSGRPTACTGVERSAVIAAALSRPAELGLPFASWTLGDAGPPGSLSGREGGGHEAQPGERGAAGLG